jgi:hypothetical protein
MKSIVYKVLLALMVTGSIVACSTNNNKTEEVKTGKEYTSAYVCPMHCEGSGSDSAGICPVCGMDYVENTHNKK